MKNMQKNTIPKHRKLHLVFRFLQGSKLYFAAAVAASLISTILNALTPQIFRFSIDAVSYTHLDVYKRQTDGYVVYADLCTLSQSELEKYHITFKKIPRDITRL